MRAVRANDFRPLTIGEAAEAVGATPRALRYYEEIGLLAPSRTAGGVRVYHAGDVGAAGDIVQLRKLGVTMKDIATFLDNRSADAACRARLADELSVRLQSIARQQAFLQTAIRRLTREPHVTAGPSA